MSKITIFLDDNEQTWCTTSKTARIGKILDVVEKF